METSPDPTPIPSPDPGRVHSAVALAILGIAGGICLVLLALAHSPGFEAWMREIRWEEAKRTKNIVLPFGHIADDADRVLNEEIPSVDHRHGGVYITGTSNTLWALKLWDLSEQQRALIHNIAIVGTGHIGQGRLLRYLVEREGMLDAGPDKTLIIFGTGYQNVGFRPDEGSNMYRALASRGFYGLGPDGSIERSAMGPLARMASIERSRLYGIAGGLKQLAQNLIRDRIGRSRKRYQDFAEFNQGRSFHMGADWRAKIDKELTALIASVDDMRAKGARVLVLLMPQGSWEANIPFDRTYNEELLKLCEARGLKPLDLRKILDDDDFADSAHLTPTGMEKFGRAVLPVCLDHLRSTGLLPAR
jgi:hypothetical protein